MQDYPGFWQAAEQQPDKIAIIEVDGREQTFAELYAHTNQVASGLQAQGLEVGDSIAVLLPNCLEVFEIFLGSSQVGLYYTAINHYLTAPEIGYILDNSETQILFVHESYRDTLLQALEHCDFTLQQCVWIGASGEGERGYHSFLAGQSTDLPARRRAGQTMLYSSGTTGNPKGVRHALPEAAPGEFYATRGNALAIFGVKPFAEVHLVNGPLHHAGPLQFASVALHYGHKVVVTPKWDAQRCLEILQQHQVTNMMMVPTMFVRLLQLPADVRERYQFPQLSVVISSAAPCSVPVKRAMIELFGPVIFDFYGGTEGAGTSCTSQQWLQKPGTSGPPVPSVQLRIEDDKGAELPAGEIGTVYLTPVQGATIPEYFKDSGKTAAAQSGDFYTLGDMGYVDEDGWLFLVDRRSDLIISGGVNIYPSEIEQVMNQHPSVRDVAVVGKPDDEWGQVVCAFVVADTNGNDEAALAQELAEFTGERLARFKQPRLLEFVAELPRADNGKLYRRRLLES